MDNYRTSRPGCGQRPTNYSNVQQPRQPSRPAVPSMPSTPCVSSTSSCGCTQNSMFDKLDTLPVAMGYVPLTHFDKTFDLCTALQRGTIFPDLFKPFCGKGGGGCK